MHQPAVTPCRAIGPILVREYAEEARVPPGTVPAQISKRLLSIRAYDAADMIVEAEVVEGHSLPGMIRLLFERKSVAYLRAHFARRGCHAARINRTTAGEVSSSLR